MTRLEKMLLLCGGAIVVFSISMNIAPECHAAPFDPVCWWAQKDCTPPPSATTPQLPPWLTGDVDYGPYRT